MEPRLGLQDGCSVVIVELSRVRFEFAFTIIIIVVVVALPFTYLRGHQKITNFFKSNGKQMTMAEWAALHPAA
jgi:hypothetical protein